MPAILSVAGILFYMDIALKYLTDIDKQAV